MVKRKLLQVLLSLHPQVIEERTSSVQAKAFGQCPEEVHLFLEEDALLWSQS